MKKFLSQTWPEIILLGILRIIIGVFCGVLIGLCAGTVNWIFVALLRYPYSPSFFDVMVGAALGTSFGFCVGVLAGVVTRGWRSGALLGVAASIVVTLWMIDLNRHQEYAPFRFGVPTLLITSLIWLITGWLMALAVTHLYRIIVQEPRGSNAGFIYTAMGVFYFLFGGYLLWWFVSYWQFHHH